MFLNTHKKVVLFKKTTGKVYSVPLSLLKRHTHIHACIRKLKFYEIANATENTHAHIQYVSMYNVQNFKKFWYNLEYTLRVRQCI